MSRLDKFNSFDIIGLACYLLLSALFATVTYMGYRRRSIGNFGDFLETFRDFLDTVAQ